MNRLVYIFVMLLSSWSLSAQNLSFFGALPAVSCSARMSNKINLNVFISSTIDGVDRTISGVRYPASDLQFYLQPSVVYIHSPQVNFGASYTYQRNNPFNSNYVNEHRLWEQIIFSFPVSAALQTNRIRFEERFIQNRDKRKYPFSTRIRYQAGLNLPLRGRSLDVHEFYFNVYNEFYFSLTGLKNATWSENWSYSGVGYAISKKSRFETGYLLQILVRNKQRNLRLLSLIQLMWIENF